MYQGPCRYCEKRPAMQDWDLCPQCKEIKLGILRSTTQYKNWVRGWAGEVKSLSWSAREYMGRHYNPEKDHNPFGKK